MDATQQGLLEREKDTMTLNMGPQHPSTHGVFRVILEMDGEVISSAEPDIGYLHTGIEKSGENMRYSHIIPMTDRLDYLNPPGNNLAFCLTVEKLMDIEIPPRADYLRVIMVELSQITPPVGFSLFIIQGIASEPVSEIIKATIPFFLIMILMVVILSIFPDLVLYLPNLMVGQ